MDKTRVDDMLIEMINPKIKEIEEKFSNGTGLAQDDINTLLLKSQYNHINHLDDKLNEVTASVVALENRFSELEGKFGGLEGKFELLRESIESTIQKALNRNMMMVGMIGFFVMLSKINFSVF
jgi:uncharacterized coiled-coil DUF342 family protein